MVSNNAMFNVRTFQVDNLKVKQRETHNLVFRRPLKRYILAGKLRAKNRRNGEEIQSGFGIQFEKGG
jgi:hypothetical protein